MTPLSEENFLPRRREILNIIRDHQTVSFNFLKRRFINVPNSTLHYELQQLIKSGLVRKLGRALCALYTITLVPGTQG